MRYIEYDLKLPDTSVTRYHKVCEISYDALTNCYTVLVGSWFTLQDIVRNKKPKATFDIPFGESLNTEEPLLEILIPKLDWDEQKAIIKEL